MTDDKGMTEESCRSEIRACVALCGGCDRDTQGGPCHAREKAFLAGIEYERKRSEAEILKLKTALEDDCFMHSAELEQLHHPSKGNHPMTSEKRKPELKGWRWPYAGRGELSCPHGVGHGGIHGCDGCCADHYFEKAKEREKKKGRFMK